MEEREKYEMDFLLKTSIKSLDNMVSTPSGLSEWFADDVNSRGEDFTFIWEDSEEYAKLLTKKNNEYIIKAFQRRFRQSLGHGNIDLECFLISKSLINHQ